MKPAFYSKRPVVIQAIQLNWKNWNDVCEFLGEIVSPANPAELTEEFSDPCEEQPPYMELKIPTLEGDHLARHGDWIVKGIKGEFYPVKPDIFEQTYEPYS